MSSIWEAAMQVSCLHRPFLKLPRSQTHEEEGESINHSGMKPLVGLTYTTGCAAPKTLNRLHHKLWTWRFRPPDDRKIVLKSIKPLEAEICTPRQLEKTASLPTTNI